MRPPTIREAWFDRNPVAYVDACVSEGFPIEDQDLLDRYLADRWVREHTTQSRLESPGSVVQSVVESKSLYAPLVRIALARFPGGRVSDVELRRRASRINELGRPVGFHLKPYSKLDRDELWSYLVQDVRREVEQLGRAYCPETLENVLAMNSRIRREERDIR